MPIVSPCSLAPWSLFALMVFIASIYCSLFFLKLTVKRIYRGPLLRIHESVMAERALSNNQCFSFFTSNQKNKTKRREERTCTTISTCSYEVPLKNNPYYPAHVEMVSHDSVTCIFSPFFCFEISIFILSHFYSFVDCFFYLFIFFWSKLHNVFKNCKI